MEKIGLGELKLDIYRKADPAFPDMVSNAAILTASAWRIEDVRAREARMLGIIAGLWRTEVLPANGKAATRA